MSQPQSDDDGLLDHCPWLYAEQASEGQRAAQEQRQKRLLGVAGAGAASVRLGEGCFVAETAAVYPEHLSLGDRSYIAAHAYVTGDIRTGADCTINPFTVVRGTVTLGNGVRVGAHSSLLGFNHGSAPDLPVHQQPVTSRGITVGDDVWIGSHVVVVDGVTIGDHCVIGAGAVVTKDLPAWTVAAGNPAHRIRDRRDPRRPATRSAAPHPAQERPALVGELSAFAAAARAQAAGLLDRCWQPDSGRYVDRPGAEPTVRAHCDAVEIAELLLGAAPPQLPAAEHTARLRALQDPVTGLVPEFGSAPPLPGPAGLPEDGASAYHVLCAGYALDLLGSSFAHPVHTVRTTTAEQLVGHLAGLPWSDRAWHAGAWVDSWATAAHWNLRLGTEAAVPGALEALFGWLHTHADPWTGMWGSPTLESGRLQMVNGYYRLTRGSFAQFGLPVPYAERVIDTVLDHARDARHFSPGRENACNVLDVIHPLWLCARQTTHRAEEARSWASAQLSTALRRWQPGRGFPFGPTPDGTGPGRDPGLQGTEMWLAIIWLLADLLGFADALGYRPRGIHRPEPAPPAVRTA
ncbi:MULTISPECIES: acyltransferase [Streptomyces]|uniref:Galactoside O-acetyltransferase n=1 Tax=Streptomyces chartreusis NRRL 3882 TaxID=1079985 RepID=A0A2N9B5S6_STRCX|nr:acyltransferase [Streptomyces chartreusis]SOR78706.1 Galactoside O-acetyltransferase [Streptomyces chartreusis NRRL 3882]